MGRNTSDNDVQMGLIALLKTNWEIFRKWSLWLAGLAGCLWGMFIFISSTQATNTGVPKLRDDFEKHKNDDVLKDKERDLKDAKYIDCLNKIDVRLTKIEDGQTLLHYMIVDANKQNNVMYSEETKREIQKSKK